jgi:hypothetical protein
MYHLRTTFIVSPFTSPVEARFKPETATAGSVGLLDHFPYLARYVGKHHPVEEIDEGISPDPFLGLHAKPSVRKQVAPEPDATA